MTISDEPVPLQPLDDVLEYRPVPDREHRLGDEERVGPEPRAEAARKDDRLDATCSFGQTLSL